MAEGSGLTAKVQSQSVPLLEQVEHYLEQGAVPGGTDRNLASYGHKIAPLNKKQQQILCDPQTSGGLLISVSASATDKIESLLAANNIPIHCIGELIAPVDEYSVLVD